MLPRLCQRPDKQKNDAFFACLILSECVCVRKYEYLITSLSNSEEGQYHTMVYVLCDQRSVDIITSLSDSVDIITSLSDITRNGIYRNGIYYYFSF